MKISIITPVKNGAAFLSETINSVFTQKGDFEIEYILIDGGSVDQTLEIAEHFKTLSENDSRIYVKIISHPDQSMYAALALGINEAKGDIMAYINSDDFYLPNAFQCVLNLFNDLPSVNWITGLPVRFNETGEITRVYIPYRYNKNLILKGLYGRELPFIQQESVFWRNTLSRHIDCEKLESFKLAGDFYLWHSFSKAGENLYIVESLFSGNRLRKGQLSENKDLYLEELNKIANKPNIVDFTFAFIHKIIDKMAGQSLKRRWSKHRIYFKNKSWICKD